MKDSCINKQSIKGGLSNGIIRKVENRTNNKIKKPELLAPAGNLENSK